MTDLNPYEESLAVDLAKAHDRIEAHAAEIERLRGDLAKAVNALERVSNSQPRPKRNGDYDKSDVSALQRIARTTLAELTGAKT